jgi:hypothetical protein
MRLQRGASIAYTGKEETAEKVSPHFAICFAFSFVKRALLYFYTCVGNATNAAAAAGGGGTSLLDLMPFRQCIPGAAARAPCRVH